MPVPDDDESWMNHDPASHATCGAHHHAVRSCMWPHLLCVWHTDLLCVCCRISLAIVVVSLSRQHMNGRGGAGGGMGGPGGESQSLQKQATTDDDNED